MGSNFSYGMWVHCRWEPPLTIRSLFSAPRWRIINSANNYHEKGICKSFSLWREIYESNASAIQFQPRVKKAENLAPANGNVLRSRYRLVLTLANHSSSGHLVPSWSSSSDEDDDDNCEELREHKSKSCNRTGIIKNGFRKLLYCGKLIFQIT